MGACFGWVLFAIVAYCASLSYHATERAFQYLNIDISILAVKQHVCYIGLNNGGIMSEQSKTVHATVAITIAIVSIVLNLALAVCVYDLRRDMDSVSGATRHQWKVLRGDPLSLDDLDY